MIRLGRDVPPGGVATPGGGWYTGMWNPEACLLLTSRSVSSDRQQPRTPKKLPKDALWARLLI